MSTGFITGVTGNIVTIGINEPVGQNEICFVDSGKEKLMAEVIKVNGKTAYAQVFESTRGIRTGLPVEFSGHLLEVELGPGILGRNYDGLQNDLDKKEGLFLKRGEYTAPLNNGIRYAFQPSVKPGDTVAAGHWLGSVEENWLSHKIMVPFKIAGKWTVRSVAEKGAYGIHETIAVLEDDSGNQENVTMTQKWPVKKAIPCFLEKPRPYQVLETGVRIIDLFNPMAEGGTGFIPGPFGCGKTVLQHAISKNADADIILVAACGERANEVVEIFTEFPELVDPRSGRKLMERTTIICNTSNMPVAAREASVYTAMTLAEYYRNMGLKVLLLADSTSRWAQALREISNRLEELPGPDAFPMDLPAIISNFYSRAGIVKLYNGQNGSVTFIGTVSPAGGNLKEPVTESTKKAARCFYALAQSRADSKRYPAVDPADSYSKYLEYPEIQDWFSMKLGNGWTEKVQRVRNYNLRGKEASEQINILGDDGVPLDYHVSFWKSETVDFVLMQQDAFDAIDSFTPLARQKYMLNLTLSVCEKEFKFDGFEQVGTYFKKVINTFKQMNYSEFGSDAFKGFENELGRIIAEKGA